MTQITSARRMAMKSVQEHHSEISSQNFGSEGMDKIRLNVGGLKHETYFNTIGHHPDTRLYWIIESVVKSPDYDPETTEIFFDRHPVVFAQILNYYRTGKLHCPTDVCGPLFEQELIYWGIDEKDMEPCCWGNYTQHRDAEENLKNVLYEATSVDPVGSGISSVDQPSEASRLYRKIQPQVWAILDESRSSNKAKIFSITTVLFIVVSVAMFCFNTVPELASSSTWRYWFSIVETVCGTWFTLELLLRIVFCPDKRAFACSWTTWIDVLSVAPFYLNVVIKHHHKAIDVLLVIRSLRLLRFFRLIYGLQVLSHTLKASSYELILLIFMLLIPVILFSSIVYFIENSLNSGNTKFRSIPHSFWWSLITITTVGYGDIYPESWLGKIVGGMCAICGVVIVALPVSIIGSNFTLFYTHAQARLRLPKKKTKIFLETESEVYSRKKFNRIAFRRKLTSRPNDSYSVTYEDSCCSACMSSIPSAKRNSSLVNDEHTLSSPSANGKKVPRKRMSNISIEIPMENLTDPGRHRSGELEQQQHESCVGIFSCCSSTKFPLLDSLTVNNVNEVDSEDVIADGISSKEERNVRFSRSGNIPEIVPLLLQERGDGDANSTEGDACSGQKLKETVANSRQHSCVGPQSFDGNDGTAECPARRDSDIEVKIHVPEGNCPEKSRTCRRNTLTADWFRQDSRFQGISDNCADNKTRHNNSLIVEPSEDLSDNEISCFEVPFDGHFISRRRQSIF